MNEVHVNEIKHLVSQIDEVNSNDICKQIAQILMCEYQLDIKDHIFSLSELEFYIYSDQHPDPYVHKNDRQKKIGKFYVHPQDGNYGGIDFTIGDTEKYIFGGVLIRGLKRECDKKFISGPNLVKKEIYNILNIENKETEKKYEQLQNISDEQIKVVSHKNDKVVRCSTRIGLKPKFEDYQVGGKYIYKLHRFITYAEEKGHKFKEKGSVTQYNK